MTVPEHTADLRFAEFFAGIGLVREGLERCGWTCQYANDIAPKKARAYAARFGHNHLHVGDVWDTGEIVSGLGAAGPVRLATASFPCVDLSTAGHYRGLSGRDSGTLYGFLRVLRDLGEARPHLLLLENVPGFLTSGGGADFRQAAGALARLGYWLDCFLLDAARFTPQSRPRVFLVGSREPRSLGPSAGQGELFAGATTGGTLRPARLRTLMAGTALETGWLGLPLPAPPQAASELQAVLDLDDDQDWWPVIEVVRHRAMMSERHAAVMSEKLRDGRSWVGTAFRRIRAGVQRLEVRSDGLAGCLRTPRGGSANQIVIAVVDGTLKMRWMTPREYARLQGADDFPLVGTKTDQLWGFADAVCVPAVEWIGRNILNPLVAAAMPDASVGPSSAPSPPVTDYASDRSPETLTSRSI